MKIKIESVKIKNFKGVTDLSIDFTDKKNILEGENGIGKTTVLDAITWCLFGKNFADEKIFKIKPIIDGEEKRDLTTVVELTLNDKKIERSVVDGTATVKVDDVKFGISEFNKYLEEKFLITDEEFKALSNIDYIPNLHWKDLRSLIMGLVGEITNEEVYEKGNFDLIKEKIESVGVEKTADDIKETKATLTNEIKKLSGNIDQKTADIQTLVVDEKETQVLLARKEDIKKEINEHNELNSLKTQQDNEIRKLEHFKEDLSNLDMEKNRLKELNIEYQKTYNNSNIDISLIKENEIKKIDNEINNIKFDIEKISLEKTSLIADREELKTKYDCELNREIKVENNTCSSCGQALPESKTQEVLAKLKEESIQLANSYADRAKEKLNRMNQIDETINSYKSKIEELELSKEEVKNKNIDSSQESELQKQMRSNIMNNDSKIEKLNEDKKNLEQNIQELEEVIKNHKPIEISDISVLQNELEDITNKLAISETLKIFKTQLNELEESYKKLLKEKELLNDKEQQLILFNNTRAEMLRERVKHNFKIADFITQETTKDGKLIETFKIAIDGIEYNSLNTGHKILVALDLIDNIQRMKDKRLPILIDGLGELTRLPELDTQIIGCRAKFQTNKKMEVVNQ